MKRLPIAPLVWLIGLLVLPAFALAQTTDDAPSKELHPNVLKMSMLKFMAGTFQMNYERQINPWMSVMLGPNAHAASNWRNNRAGWGMELQPRFYFDPFKDLSVEGPDRSTRFYGMYVGPFATFSRTTLNEEFQDWTQPGWNDPPVSTFTSVHNTYGGGAVLGAQLAFGGVFVTDFYLGGIARYNNMVSGQRSPDGWEGTRNNVFWPLFHGVAPRCGLQIGFAF